ncbi:hypothetical protein B0J11DRAFT_512719 [Dendryphion nanum]|uniref:Uncharacterized protein n=1 Tax=Dendryphion nanum TaxID=256645 RepID=A0A9P9I6R3_9PLEO|nr:hypothetical protein B0J11DRAFT_512719 [Dendryphion nanum]
MDLLNRNNGLSLQQLSGLLGTLSMTQEYATRLCQEKTRRDHFHFEGPSVNLPGVNRVLGILCHDNTGSGFFEHQDYLILFVLLEMIRCFYIPTKTEEPMLVLVKLPKGTEVFQMKIVYIMCYAASPLGALETLLRLTVKGLDVRRASHVGKAMQPTFISIENNFGDCGSAVHCTIPNHLNHGSIDFVSRGTCWDTRRQATRYALLFIWAEHELLSAIKRLEHLVNKYEPWRSQGRFEVDVSAPMQALNGENIYRASLLRRGTEEGVVRGSIQSDRLQAVIDLRERVRKLTFAKKMEECSSEGICIVNSVSGAQKHDSQNMTTLLPTIEEELGILDECLQYSG